jgi:hypothetical protein
MKRAMFLTALALVSGSVVLAGEKIEIIKAEYGAQDKWGDVTTVVQSKVTGDSLKIAADNNILDDPAPGLGKVLKVTAKAGDKQADFKCNEGESIEINAEKIAAVAKAAALKAAASTAPKVKTDTRLVIISAEYGADDKKADVAEKVRNMVANGTKKIPATNELFGDPAEGVGKVLTIKYKLDGKESTVTAGENESLDLP